MTDAEFTALQTEFGAYKEISYTGVFTLEGSTWDIGGKTFYPFVLMRSFDRSNGPANESVRDLVEKFQPEYILLVGTAGGIMRPSPAGPVGPRIGDVVVASYVHYASYSKSEPDGNKQRYYPITQPSIELVTHANAIKHGRNTDWAGAVSVAAPDENHAPIIHVDEVISTEAIAGNPDSKDQQQFLARFDHAVGVDMESNGVGRAIAEAGHGVHYAPQWVAIRGVSDPVASVPGLLEDNNGALRTQWTGYATAVAGAFAHRLVERLLASPRPPSDSDPGVSAWPSL